jgi:hypothetical protein
MRLSRVIVEQIGHLRHPNFHLVPRTRSERISQAAIRRSFDEVPRFEPQGRKVIAPGEIAAGECGAAQHRAYCGLSSQQARI